MSSILQAKSGGMSDMLLPLALMSMQKPVEPAMPASAPVGSPSTFKPTGPSTSSFAGGAPPPPGQTGQKTLLGQ
jgi:hypothetical protein